MIEKGWGASWKRNCTRKWVNIYCHSPCHKNWYLQYVPAHTKYAYVVFTRDFILAVVSFFISCLCWRKWRGCRPPSPTLDLPLVVAFSCLCRVATPPSYQHRSWEPGKTPSRLCQQHSYYSDSIIVTKFIGHQSSDRTVHTVTQKGSFHKSNFVWCYSYEQRLCRGLVTSQYLSCLLTIQLSLPSLVQAIIKFF